MDEGDQEISQQIWRGTEKNAQDTSGFGNMVLTDVLAKEPENSTIREALAVPQPPPARYLSF